MQWQLSDWVTAINSDPRKYRKLIVDTCRSRFANIHVNWAVTRSLAQLYQTFPCTECQKSFSTKQALAVHSFKAHGTKRLQRRYVVTTHCEVCLVEFWTRERLVCHLAEKSSICWANYVAFPPRLSEAQANELDAVDAGSMRQASRSEARRHSVITPLRQIKFSLMSLVHSSRYA